MPLIHVQDASLAFGHVPLLDHAELVVDARERVCLVGRNGAGKSTLLNVLAGQQALDEGRLWRRDGLGISKLAQEVPDADGSTVFEVVAAGLGDHSALLARYHKASLTLAEGGDAALAELGRLQAEVEHAGAWEGSERIEAALSRLALPPDALMAQCSGGIRRRAMLGQALVSAPDLLLLDEPTNHFDIDAIVALEDALLGYPGAVVFITHDRAFIDRLATRIIELDRGRLSSFPGSYALYLDRKSEELEAEADASRKFDQALAQEEVWIRQGIKARRTRNEGRVRRLEAMRRERAERRNRQGDVKMRLAAGEGSGKLVLEAEHVTFSYGDAPVVRGLTTTVMRRDRIGIVGPNGSGKTTLLRLLLGQVEPASGTIRRGTQLEVAYFDQERLALDPEASVRDNVAEGSDQIEIGGRSRHVVSYLADFLFPPARIRSPVKSLSGGERNRLLLAKLFARPVNLLVLDEPTNDLDVETLELLEELIGDYDGTLLLVSHDRRFLDGTVTSLMVLTGDGRVEEHVGGYSDWRRYQEARATAARPRQAAEKALPGRGGDAGAMAGAAPRREDRSPPRKLGYTERLELEALPELIESLEAKQAELQSRLSDPAFYRQAPDVVTEVAQALAEIGTRLQRAYERWERLEG